ncbi:mucin-19-like isoform X2 [Frieseomelitta varia]|uniref:mucin-19-like isoform X2 n=1 Tax=Frieseomelitta varia TaxID=561572 RepID=UPI001CB698DC|nr:mucin-19-like isoform X2 [Frieseomelitta varia]
MIDRTCFAVLLGLLGLVCGLQCPKQRTSPGREVVCYTSVSDVDQLTEAVCKCTTLVQQGHDVRNLSLSEFEGFQKSLKKISPWLQFVVSVDDPGRTLRTSGTVRQEIIARLMGVLKEIDGVELNVTAGSKERLVHFVKGLKDELVRKSYDSRLFLVLPTNSEELAKQFDLKELTKYVDLFTVPTHYLIEDDATRRTFHPSRLMGLFDMFNADSLIDLISGLGVPKRKILISLPASAYKFTLKDQDDNAPGAPAEEIQPVIVDQKELCDLMNKGEWTVERDEDLTAPYAFKDKTWIAFEDRISVSIKGKYALIRELPGLAVHGVENDFKTKCGIPLTHEVHRSFSSFKRKSRAAVLNSLEDDLHQTELEYSTKVKSSDFRVVRVVDTEGHIRVVRENTQTEFTCSRQGYFVHPKSCNRFYRCVKFNQEVEDYSVFEFDCPAGLSFDERTEVCVWPGSLPEGSPCPGSSEIAPVPRVRFECPSKSGYYADPQNPRWFFACVDLGGPEITAYEFRCPFGLIFDEQKLICEWPWLVPGYSDTAYTRSEYYGTGTTAGTGGYYTGELPYGYAGSKSGGGYTGSTVATGSGFSGAAGVRGSPFGQGTGYAGSAGASHGTSYSGQGSGAYTGTTASGYSGIGAIDHGTSYTGQGSGVYSETIGSGYSGAGTAHGTSYTGQGSGVYSGTPGSGYSGAGVTHGTSYTGQGSGSGYSGTGATQGTSYTGPGSGVYSGTPGSGYSGAGATHGTSYTGQGSSIYSGSPGSGYSGAGVTHGTSYTSQGSGSGYSGTGATQGTSFIGQGSGVYSGSPGSGYSGAGVTHGTSYTGQGSGSGYSGTGATQGTSFTGQGSSVYSGATGSGYSGAGATQGTSYTGPGSGVYSGTPGSGYSGAGVTHGTSYTGQGSGSGYSGTGATQGTSFTGQGSSVYSGATGSGYSGAEATQGTSYTGPGSGVYSGTPGSGYSGAGATHGTSYTGQGSSVYSGAGGFGHETSGSGIYSGTTGSGYSGAGGVTHETSYTNQGTTGSGYSGSGADHGYSGTGTSYSETGHYGGSRGKEYSGGTIGTGYTGVGSIGHVGTTGSVAPGQGYTGKGFVGHDTSAGGYSATKGGSTGGYAGTSSGTHIIDHTGSGGYPGSTGSSAGIGYSGTGSAGITGYSGQTFGSGQSQTPVYPSSGAPGTGLEHGVTDIYSQTPRPLFADKPQTPTCVTINCYGFSQPSDGQTIVTGYVPSHGATGTNIYQGTTGFSRGLNATFGSHVPSIGGVTYYGGVTPTGSFGVATDTGGIVTGHGIQGSIITGDSTPGTLISHGGASGTVFTSSSNQGSITTGENHPGYTKTGPGSPGYVISDGVKTLFPGSASPGTTIYGTPAPGVVVAETPLPATVIRGQPSPGIVLTGQTVPGVSIGGSIVPGTVVSSSADFAHGGLDFSTPGSPFGTKIGTTPSTFDTGYKTNEYHDNGGRGTIRFNNGDVTTKYTENDIPDYRPTGGAIPPDTLLPGRKGPGAISTGFTKTGPTKTGFTTATLGAGGSYVISTGRTSPAPNPDHIGAKAFEGNVAGYTKSSTESSANAYTGATSTYRPNNLGYSYPTPSIPFDTGVTKNLPISSTESGVVGITTPTPFLSVDIYNTPKFGEITGSPTVASTYPRPSGFTRAPTATSTPLLYTTGPLENYKTTVFEAARIPVTVSTVQPLIDTGYKTVVSPTQVPVTISRDKFGTGPGTTVFKVSSKYPVGEPQYDYGPTTPSPAIGVTYGIPFSLPGVSYQQSTPLPSGSPTNVAIGREEVGKLVTNYNRGTTKYVPSQFDDGYAISRQNYGSSTTTYSAGYSRSSSLTTYQTTDKSTAVGRGKVIVKWSDLHPILLGKLGAECTCRGDPFANLRGPGSKLINSSKGKVDLSNYDESEIYVDLEKEGSYESQDYQVTNHESSSSLSSKQPVKIYNELSQAIGATSTQAPSFAYLPSVGSSSSGFTANFRSSAKSLSQGKRLAVERSVVDAPDDDSSSDRSEETDASEEIIDGSAHCARPGLFRHPNFCNKFYACHWDEWKKRFTLHVFKCPVHLTFDKAAAACNWPSMGPACQDDNLLV